MVVKEFEGKNEEEAIERAIQELGLNREDIDVEIVESVKPKFLFGSGKVKIRVHMGEEYKENEQEIEQTHNDQDDFADKIIQFLAGLFKKMNISADIQVSQKESNKIWLNIISNDSGILIGKQGKTLEAIQLIINIVAGRLGESDKKIIIDTEDYRKRKEKSIVSFAYRTAEQVRTTGKSRLLEAMNPFERRLVHTALNQFRDIETISEGEGLYKKIRIIYRQEGHQQID